MTEDETLATLSVLDKDGVCHFLTRLSSSEAHRSLGVCSALDGNNHAQVDFMQTVADEWSDKLQTGHLTKAEAWTALTTRVKKTLLYATPAMNLTQDQSAFVMAPILLSGLNAVGIQ